MNVIYIFIPLILLSMGMIDHSYAEVEKGPNFDRELISVENGVKTYTWKSVAPRILEESQYKDFIFTDGDNSLMVETMSGSITLDKTTCGFSFHNKGFLFENPSPLFSDSIVPYSKIVGSDIWSVVSQVDNASCSVSWNGMELVATKTSIGIGTVSYKYILNNGVWKTELEATNLTGLTDRVFGFDQTINLNRDIVFYGGSQRNLDNYHGVTFDRDWLESNEGEVIQFLNGYYFDLNIGFEYLDSVSVFDTGDNSSQLVFHYMRNNDVLLPFETLVIDPTYGPTAATDYRVYDGAGTGASCPQPATTKDSGVLPRINLPASAVSDNCNWQSWQWDVSSITDTIVISDSVLTIDINSITTGANCDINRIQSEPATTAAGTLYKEIDGTASGSYTYVDNDSFCATTGANKNVDLGSQFDLDCAANINTGWCAIGVFFNAGSAGRGASGHDTRFGGADLTLTYSVIPNPDAVLDLSSPGQSFGSVDLLWTEPNLNTGNLSGYQINYTTPFGQPNTIITNDTHTSTVSTTVTGLSGGTDYSFRVGVWTEGFNGSGNILNITTVGDFAIGTALFNQTNTEVLPITFEEQDINGTAKFLNVTYANTFNMSCDFHYKFANTNQTYSSLTGTPVSTTLDETSFIFNDFENEIIDVYCWDTLSNTDGEYILIQNDFPLLQQIASFRAGDYGTDGKIGVFDFITIAVIIFSMIGLNRVNESVGAIFNVALLGALAYFGIIELPTIIFGIIAVVLVFAITSTRKT